jgi:hypothetical protein
VIGGKKMATQDFGFLAPCMGFISSLYTQLSSLYYINISAMSSGIARGRLSEVSC